LIDNLAGRPDDFRLGYNRRNYPFFVKGCGKSKEETQIGAAACARRKNFRTGGKVLSIGILKPRNLEILYLWQAAAVLAGGLIGRPAPGGDDLTGIVYDKNFPAFASLWEATNLARLFRVMSTPTTAFNLPFSSITGQEPVIPGAWVD
jgi:hypothetical protein